MVDDKSKSKCLKTGIVKVFKLMDEDFGSISKAQPVKINLTFDRLTLLRSPKIAKKEEKLTKSSNNSTLNSSFHYAHTSFHSSLQDFRIVKLIKEKGVGFGFSIKGGSEYHLPILISSIVKNGPADKTRKLFIGDMIIKINDQAMSTSSTTQEEMFKLLKNCKLEVNLTVKHYKSVAPILIKSWKKESNIKLPFLMRIKENEQRLGGLKLKDIDNNDVKSDEDWIEMVSINLLSCHLTKYIHDSDKVRPNRFEVRWLKEATTSDKAVNWIDKKDEALIAHNSLSQNKIYSSVIVSCDNFESYKEWTKAIDENVKKAISNQIIKINDNILSKEDQVLHMGWISQGLPSKQHEAHRPCYQWSVKYMVIKGGDVYLYTIPPKSLISMETGKPINWLENNPLILKAHQSLLRYIKKSELVDERENCFLLSSISSSSAVGQKSGQPLAFYFSAETNSELMKILNSWNKATYYSVIQLGVSLISFALFLFFFFPLFETKTNDVYYQHYCNHLDKSQEKGCKLDLFNTFSQTLSSRHRYSFKPKRKQQIAI